MVTKRSRTQHPVYSLFPFRIAASFLAKMRDIFFWTPCGDSRGELISKNLFLFHSLTYLLNAKISQPLHVHCFKPNLNQNHFLVHPLLENSPVKHEGKETFILYPESFMKVHGTFFLLDNSRLMSPILNC